MSYRLLKTGVQRIADSLIITRDMAAWGDYRAWLKAGNSPLPMVIEPQPVPSLAEVKRQRAQAITTEALARIHTVLPEVANMATAQLVRELWLSIAPAARQPTAKMNQVIAVYQAWNVAVDQIRDCSTPACVAGVSVNWPAQTDNSLQINP